MLAIYIVSYAVVGFIVAMISGRLWFGEYIDPVLGSLLIGAIWPLSIAFVVYVLILGVIVESIKFLFDREGMKRLLLGKNYRNAMNRRRNF